MIRPMRVTLLLLAACGGAKEDGTSPVDTDTGTPTTDTSPPPTPTTEPQGECGDVTYWDLTVTGRVVDALGDPASGVEVWLEDRAWNPTTTILGQAVSGADGGFEFAVADLVSVEDCWATLLDYALVGQRGDEIGEVAMNSVLFAAIDGGTFVADVSYPPLSIEAE